MNILFYLGKFPVLSETFIARQVEALIENGHQVTILAEEEGDVRLLKTWTIIADKAILYLGQARREPKPFASIGAVPFRGVTFARQNRQGWKERFSRLSNQPRLSSMRNLLPAALLSFDVVISHFGHVAVRFYGMSYKRRYCID